MRPVVPQGSVDMESFKGVTNNLGNNTGMHGVPNITRARGSIRRFVWCIVTLGAFGGLAWQSWVLIAKYYTYPVDTEVLILSDTALEYPMISICNMNPLRMSSLVDAPVALQEIYGYHNGTFVDLNKDEEDEEEHDDDNESDAAKSARLSAGWSRLQNQSDLFSSHSMKHAQKIRQLYEMRLMHDMNDVTPQNLTQMGHNLTWMLMGCQFNGYQCTPENFTHFFNPYFGNCYSFNTGIREKVIKTSRAGPIYGNCSAYGLVLELFVEHNEYISDFSSAAGVKVVVGNQSDMPYPEDDGISVTVGTQTSISLSRMDIKRAKPPYGRCRDYEGHDDHIRNLYTNQSGFNIKYSDRSCYKTCFQKHVIKACHCCEPVHPCRGYAIEKKFDFVPEICNVSKPEIAECALGVSRLYEEGMLDCTKDCPPSCSEVTYKSEISAAHWPTKRMVMSVGRNLKDKVDKDSEFIEKLVENDLGDVDEFLRENVLKLEIFYRKLNYESVRTWPSFVEGDLLSNFGGQLGLWLGLSIVTIFEFIEYIIDLLMLVCRKLGRNSGDKVNPFINDGQ